MKNYKEIFNNYDIDSLNELAGEIRDFFINFFINKKFGHLGSSLGTIEIIIALLKNYNVDNNIFLFDTGHQSYAYKLLTEGLEKFKSISDLGGISNFQEFHESKFNFISNGHTSTSLAYALGYSIMDTQREIIVLIGDTSFLSGLTISALLNIKQYSNKKITIILNDNEESIGKNNLYFNKFKEISELFDIKYFFCKEGNSISNLDEKIKLLKKEKGNCLLHIKTVKSYGFENKEELFVNHNVSLNKNKKSYGVEISKKISEIFNNEMYLISSSMLYPTFFNNLFEEFSQNVFDTGVNEDFSVLFASSISLQNKKCIVSIYSTFFNKVFDQVVNDVIRNNLNLLFLIDRAGLSSVNGISHHGIYDLSLANNFKESIIFQPFSLNDLNVIINKWNNSNLNRSFFIRYEDKEYFDNKLNTNFNIGEWEYLIFDKLNKKTLIAYGNPLIEFKKIINSKKLNINLINARFINPIDHKMLENIKNTEWYIYEQVINKNNLYENIKNYFRTKKDIVSFAFSSNKIYHGSESQLLKENNMDYDYIINNIIGDDYG